MKTFWAVIVVLVVAAAALLLLDGSKPAPAPAPEPAPREAESAPAPVADPAQPVPTRVETPTAPSVAAPAPTIAIETAPAPAAPPPSSTATAATADPFPPATAPTTPAPTAPPPHPGHVQRAADPNAPPSTPTAPTAEAAQRAESRLAVSGSGTAEDPYVVSWGVLLSAQETYKPKLGKKEIPERVQALHGKRVRITGFLAFPFMAAQASELLVMQNMWDGCCIGVPPTPYDAIEVVLSTPADGALRFMQYGSVEGTLKVDPFVRGDWLISLYTMSDAKLTPEM